MAIWTGLMSASKQIGGVVAINAAVPIQNIGNVSNPGVPIAHFHGDNNKVIPIKLARKGREVAELAGAKAYTFIENQGGHDLSSGVSREISLWLSRNIASPDE
jgi:predicted esterase